MGKVEGKFKMEERPSMIYRASYGDIKTEFYKTAEEAFNELLEKVIDKLNNAEDYIETLKDEIKVLESK